jgi:predicted alpha-1,6-mannanase (GH76 family)
VIGAVGYRSLSPRSAPAAEPGPIQLPVAVPKANDPATRALLNQYAAVGVAKLATMYNAGSNRATRSWRGANALAAITDYMQASGSRAYLNYLSETYLAHIVDPRPFINRYYDDEGWWALTWIKAYDLTRDPQYLALARSIFGDLTKGWTPACGGGLRWSKFASYKDAISNALFLQASALLHAAVPGDTKYGRWALREWKWFSRSGMITRSGLVVDGMDPATCKPILNSTTWTYNQGAVIGGLVDLYKFTHQQRLLLTARKIADAVIRSPRLSPGGILTEPACGPAPTCANDAPTFKGIFTEDLQLLNTEVHVPEYETYLLHNAVSMWAHDRNGGAFGLNWAGPFDSSDTGRQVAALDLLITQVTGVGKPVPGLPQPSLQPTA